MGERVSMRMGKNVVAGVKNPSGEKLPAGDMTEIEGYITIWTEKEEAERSWSSKWYVGLKVILRG